VKKASILGESTETHGDFAEAGSFFLTEMLLGFTRVNPVENSANSVSFSRVRAGDHHRKSPPCQLKNREFELHRPPNYVGQIGQIVRC